MPHKTHENKIKYILIFISAAASASLEVSHAFATFSMTFFVNFINKCDDVFVKQRSSPLAIIK